MNHKQTHCKQGHEFTEANTIICTRLGKPSRSCKACHAIRSRLKYRSDEAHREYHRAKGKRRYAKQKELKEARHMIQFEARKTNASDCKQCFNARGIWVSKAVPHFWLCDHCFYELANKTKKKTHNMVRPDHPPPPAMCHTTNARGPRRTD